MIILVDGPKMSLPVQVNLSSPAVRFVLIKVFSSKLRLMAMISGNGWQNVEKKFVRGPLL
jgi:hypothetical protein